MKKILITGASGFIGSFIVEEALKRGFEAWAAVRRSSSKEYLQDERIHFIELNLSSKEQLMEQTEKLLYGQCINYSGWLHSNEYRRNALANDVTAQVIRDEKRNLFLHINEMPITQWFKEQFGIGQEQRRGIKM